MQATRKHGPLLALSTLAALTLAATHPAQAQGTITFENVPQAYHATSEGGGGQNLGGYYQGVTFTGVTVYSTDAAVNPIPSSYPPHSGTSEIGSSSSTFSVLFTAPSTGTAFWYTSGLAPGSIVTATLAGGGTEQYTLAPNYGSNAQLQLAGSVTGFSIASPSPNVFGLDDLSGSSFTGVPAGAASTVPEPSSVAAFAFTALGLTALILRARKRPTA